MYEATSFSFDGQEGDVELFAQTIRSGTQSALSAAAGSTVAGRAAGPEHAPIITPASSSGRKRRWIVRSHFEQEAAEEPRREGRSRESDRDTESNQRAAL